MSQTGLRTEALSVGYQDRQVIRGLDLAFPVGRSTAILGPNGCGKSTLLRALARLLKPAAGRVLLGDTDIHAADTRDLARRLAILPQFPLAPDAINVGELVRRGRTPWRGMLSPWTQEDSAACTDALGAVGLTDMADRPLAELSGGQRQRAWLALVLAQQTPLLLLDEPTSHLDLAQQIDMLKLLQQRVLDTGMTVISVLHDLNLAARFSDHLVLLSPQGLVAEGTPEAVMTAGHLQRAFGLAAQVMTDPLTGRPWILPH
ncbi:ABC transporter ATP-binding protein [Thalassobaculum sp. OXR-137]|uniref:ABC transporter ATP-binding protein n=1 Tax=Thalassobaculum sp. OXR-137 TaxID=3100173 RepID=UPI002AC8AC1E|nr:ABC transporter ATP-binding protein [Thalassobaculum sp. OXR-137]WPZ32715.1 ABC transporter ATP-binding protein [Thalassobaculum sp. OXR-137]